MIFGWIMLPAQAGVALSLPAFFSDKYGAHPPKPLRRRAGQHALYEQYEARMLIVLLGASCSRFWNCAHWAPGKRRDHRARRCSWAHHGRIRWIISPSDQGRAEHLRHVGMGRAGGRRACALARC
jgi:hypothetical protein